MHFILYDGIFSSERWSYFNFYFSHRSLALFRQKSGIFTFVDNVTFKHRKINRTNDVRIQKLTQNVIRLEKCSRCVNTINTFMVQIRLSLLLTPQFPYVGTVSCF